MHTFTLTYYKEIFQNALLQGYDIVTLKDFCCGNYQQGKKLLINRIDVDCGIDYLSEIQFLFWKLGIKGSFYLRMHADNYNLFAFENINLVKKLLRDGHEIGLHTELIDVETICGVNSSTMLKASIELFESFFDIKIDGTASHGGLTGLNNLDFWKNHKPADFGLIYEAYDDKLFGSSRYISDSGWRKWKVYENGKFLFETEKSPADHFKEGVPVIYLLTHPAIHFKDKINN